ncbi:zinc-binding alcohol dehydrogenase family protein [Alteromonas pelagimontana]|uniref:Zinc-type alcohol dehydrogenase-like protein n=1 Tax=Alteromonas pelagimontana TaxID=1858656 RepID=A0A6M4MFV5_9ALTE|nr:zinc-binding alcohol dehydrogenase family protein [Alteromonas pelagimontana]QJR82051.1 zinc-binding alcohol dehydrogenase family protein [Alteromonas pelagimontana]
MLAFGYKQATTELKADSLQAVNMSNPVPAGRDILVAVEAISVNPVDTKIRKSVEPAADTFKVLGWDAVGVVKEVGNSVSLFKPGDRVFYAGDISRQGSNAEYQLVDERIVGRAPTSLSNAEAAALPLTSLTAWELLFSRLQVPTDSSGEGKILLVVGAAGGVGSILVQLARRLTSLTVVGTASRGETKQWVKDKGAHYVIDHNHPLDEQLKKQGIEKVDFVASLTHTDVHFEACVNALAAQGRFGLIDDPGAIDIALLKRKSISLHWEFMYTRSLFNTNDMQEQHDILCRIADMVDEGQLTTTVGKNLGEINVENLLKAHQILESNRAMGKLVLEGFNRDQSPVQPKG